MDIGEFVAHETKLCCDSCEETFVSEELLGLAPPKCKFGYDVMVRVGKALFMRHRTSREVAAELAENNVTVSLSEIDVLGKKFIVYLAIAHRQSSERIKAAMRLNGGYMLHLDGTFDGRGPMLMTGLDSITEIVLGNVKLPSEKAEKIVPFLQDVKLRFGSPVALVHDMGSGILRAVAQVFPHVPDFICHFHFLRDIGKDLMGREYDRIRSRTRSHRITSKLRSHARELKRIVDENPRLVDSFCGAVEAGTRPEAPREFLRAISAFSLIEWILEGMKQGDGYGFPFDRPHVVFAQRLRVASSRLPSVPKPKGRAVRAVARTLHKLSRDLKIIASDTVLQETIGEIRRKADVFDQLREAMRIAPKSGPDGLNCDGMDADIQTIRGGVNEFRRRLRAQPELSGKKEYKALLAQIEKYRDKLFADPITVHSPSGLITIQPQRTNNILERFFRGFKRGFRRKTGNSSLGKTIKAMIADTPLVKNLENRQYVDILLDGKATLEERFAEIDIETVRQELKTSRQSAEKIPYNLKRIIKDSDFLQKITKILRQRR